MHRTIADNRPPIPQAVFPVDRIRSPLTNHPVSLASTDLDREPDSARVRGVGLRSLGSPPSDFAFPSN
jgi:hypothetical protein